MSKLFLIFLALPMLLLSFFLGKWIPLEEQKTVFESLTSITSNIFTILGIWLALFYPDTISKIFNEKQKTEIKKLYYEEKNEIFKRLSLSLVITTFILILCILTNFIIPIIKNLSFFHPMKYQLRGLFFSYLFGLGILQIFTLLCALLPNSFIDTVLKRNKEDQEYAKRSGPVTKD